MPCCVHCCRGVYSRWSALNASACVYKATFLLPLSIAQQRCEGYAQSRQGALNGTGRQMHGLHGHRARGGQHVHITQPPQLTQVHSTTPQAAQHRLHTVHNTTTYHRGTTHRCTARHHKLHTVQCHNHIQHKCRTRHHRQHIVHHTAPHHRCTTRHHRQHRLRTVRHTTTNHHDTAQHHAQIQCRQCGRAQQGAATQVLRSHVVAAGAARVP